MCIMKKPPVLEYELTISGYGAEGEGVGKNADGKTVFVKWALPNERVRVFNIKSLKAFDIARLSEVLDPSPDRCPPPCPLFRRCGGCGVQHLSYAAQLDFKADKVRQTLHKYAGIDVPVEPTVQSPFKTRYRNKFSVPVREGRDGAVEIGFFMSGSHRVVPLDDCLLQPEWNKTLLALTRAFLSREKIAAYNENSGRGVLRHLTAREKNGHLVIAAVVTKNEPKLAAFFEDLSKAFPRVSLYQNLNARRDNVILGRDWVLIGEKGVEEGADAPPHPAAFYQVNDAVSERLYADAVGEIGGETVIDAYSGAGRLSAQIAATAKAVYGIEIDESAHADALKLKAAAGIDNLHPVLGDCATELPRLLGKLTAPLSVVLDPPRKGCDAAVLTALNAYTPQKIVYISCNPATLARDIKALSAAYRVTLVRPYDMFPQTAEVETLCVLNAGAFRAH